MRRGVSINLVRNFQDSISLAIFSGKSEPLWTTQPTINDDGGGRKRRAPSTAKEPALKDSKSRVVSGYLDLDRYPSYDITKRCSRRKKIYLVSSLLSTYIICNSQNDNKHLTNDKHPE